MKKYNTTILYKIVETKLSKNELLDTLNDSVTCLYKLIGEARSLLRKCKTNANITNINKFLDKTSIYSIVLQRRKVLNEKKN